MIMSGLQVKKLWVTVIKFLGKYTDWLKYTDEQDRMKEEMKQEMKEAKKEKKKIEKEKEEELNEQ